MTGEGALTVTMVTDRLRLPPGLDLAAAAAAAAAAGADFVQLREKDQEGRALLEIARQVAAVLRPTAARLVVSARPDVALLAGAYGVQLPSEGLAVRDVRRAFAELAVGASCHAADEVRQAADDGADWAVLGPVFATPGKERRALGLDALRAAVSRAAIPVFAIGGITPATVPAVREAGARGLLAIRPFLGGEASALVRAARAA